MGLVKNLEDRIKVNKVVSLSAFILSFGIVVSGFVFAYKLVEDARKSIYVIDNGIPVLVKQTDLLMNRPVEYKAQIDLFHQLFFTLTPDDDFIKTNTKKALYLIDDTGMKEFMNLKENGFYNQVISSNSVITIKADSINVNLDNLSFTYYGKQTINRKSSLIIRKIVTKGYVSDIPRTPNNPHGVMLKNWKTTDNSDLSVQEKFR